ncbi:MAG: LacI family transcriptional regulator [Verrucomicrobia bacterium]|nr:LacI family transcriptional regulator [Verrucomicrobiota bacterium]
MKLARITLEDIAKLGQVHKMTVSRALRDDPRISPATRKRIQRIARELGYQANPLVSIYQAHVRSGQPIHYQATIGWVNDHPNASYWHDAPWTRGLYEGAARRAKELGFVLDEIWLDRVESQKAEVNIARYCRVIRARGIHGVILPLSSLYSHAFRRWPELSVAVIGLQHSIARQESPPDEANENVYHTASFDYFGNIRLACEHLREAGYRRIGLVISRWMDAHSDLLYRGGFLAQQLDWPRAEHVPILFDNNAAMEPSRPFVRWLDRHRPDVVICSTNLARGWIETTGRRVPRDIGLVHLYLAADVKGWSGIDPNMPEVGGAAVDLVVQQLRLNQRGLPRTCHELFVTGRWMHGKTTRQPPTRLAG